MKVDRGDQLGRRRPLFICARGLSCAAVVPSILNDFVNKFSDLAGQFQIIQHNRT